jgi:predicted metal-dependent phosphoesterase TrpH
VIVDFHSHTLKSDGTASPAELLELMVRKGVEYFAVTDHDTLAAYDELGERPGGPRLIKGIEINTFYQGDDVHILGYGLTTGASPLNDGLERRRQARSDRLEAMVGKLRAGGVAITFDEVRSLSAGVSALGRPHLAKLLVARGYAGSVNEAFNRYLQRGSPAYIEAAPLSPFEAILLIRESGGIPVLAHPGRLKDPAIVDTIARAGILGIEVFYGTHTAEQTERFRGAAEYYHLSMSAGADYHDADWTPWGVGMEVRERDILPFLKLIGVG